MRPRKRFGQHFLHDPAIIDRIVSAIDPRPGQAILEIGPGRGALTAALIDRAGHIDAVEIDRDLATELRLRFAERLSLHEGDALAFDLPDLARDRGRAVRVVGNLPYNVSTPLLFQFVQARGALADLHVMLQKEVIDRMVAPPGTAAYGRLTVMLAPWFDITRLFDVGPGAFSPPPRVWSAVARLEVRDPPRFDVPAAYSAIVAGAFAQRRKTLRNALRTHLDAEAIAACGVDPGARAETLRPEDFARLAYAAAGR